MKFLIFMPLFVAVCTAQFNPFGTIANIASNVGIPGFEQNWSSFLTDNGKKYLNAAEETLRKNIFKTNLERVSKFNEGFKQGKVSYELGVNPFSDLNPIEFLQSLTGLKRSPEGEKRVKLHRNKSTPPSLGKPVPESFDWREKGGVTPVKFQGLECGACWSFAVTGAIEGHVFRKSGKLVNLSEQNLVDCGNPYGNTGCDGGFQDYGFDYVLDNKGINAGESYPYIEKQEQCHYKDAAKSAEIIGYSVISPGNVTKIKEVIAHYGPVAASVNASPDTFQLYKSGIYKDNECNKEDVNHSILIVGYGRENNEDYWIIKNSWTDKWGEKGFMKLARGHCGIETEVSYPVV